MPTCVERARETLETRVRVRVCAPGSGEASVRVENLPLLEHMLETLARYAELDLEVNAEHVNRWDPHHLVEDVAIVLGEALAGLVVGAGGRIARFGWAVIPMDDSLVLVALDAGGRPYWSIELPVECTVDGQLSCSLLRHFLETLAARAKWTLHARKLAGWNHHHTYEAAFKALGLALKQALQPVERVRSTKGTLG